MSHLSAVDDAQLDDDELAHLAMLLAETGFWGLGRAAETDAALRRLEQRIESDGRSTTCTRTPVRGHVRNQRPSQALRRSPSRSRPTRMPTDSLAFAPSTAAAGWLSFSGDPSAALELCETLLPVGIEHANESQRGVGWVVAQMLVAYNCLGRFDEADADRCRRT